MNYLLWFQLLTRVGLRVASENGAAPRELAYLGTLTKIAGLTATTQKDLEELRDRYEAEVAGGAPVTPTDLEAIAARIEARGAQIQGG